MTRTRPPFPALLLAGAAALLTVVPGCSREPGRPGNERPSPTTQAAAPVPAPSAVADPRPPATPSPQPARTKIPNKPKDTKAPVGSPLARFAKCLTDQGATMYGVFWCEHCREQEELFGESFQYVHYVECVAPDAPRTLIPECKAQGIAHTPTWIFRDGSRLEGAQPLAALAEKTGCKAP